jgi:hypothetical protein
MARNAALPVSRLLLISWLGLFPGLAMAVLPPDAPRLLGQPLNSGDSQARARAMLGQSALRQPAPATGSHTSAQPFLAALDYLRQLGAPVQQSTTLAVLDSLDPRGASLVLLADRSTLPSVQSQRLLRWVHAGGRLVLVAQASWDEGRASSGDDLLDRLQVQRVATAQLPPVPSAERVPFGQLTRLYLENEKAPAYFSFDPAWHLEDPADLAIAWANNATATHLMQVAWGDGLVTILSDSQLWANPAIGDYDNAWLLWYLTQKTRIVLVIDPPAVSWRAQMWQRYAQALVALLALLLLGGWSVLGGPRPSAARSCRAWLGSMRAALPDRRSSPGPSLALHALQEDIGRRAGQRHRGFQRLPVAEQWQVLARLTRQPTAVIAQALSPRPADRATAQAIHQQTILLQALRNAL